MTQRLYRSNRNRIAFGVCGGIAERFGWDPTWVRLAFIVATFAGGPGVLAYLILLCIVPRNPALPASSYPALGS